MVTEISRRTFLAAAAAGLVRAQDATSLAAPAIVNVLATVRDKQGKIVTNLTKDDFTLTVEDRPRAIQSFSRQTDLPLTLGLLVDTSRSQRQSLSDEKAASRHFIDQILREDRDQGFLIHFDRESELLQDLTESREKLERALDQLQLAQEARPQLQRRGGGYPGGGGYPRGGYPGGGGDPGAGRRGGNQARTTLYDAVLLASDELMRKRQGRKALMLLSDGADKGSKVPLSQAIEAAERADTLVYSIRLEGEEQQSFGRGGFGGRRGRGRFPQQQRDRPDGKKIMEQISRETGGGFFEVTKKLPVDAACDKIAEELRNQYSLGFAADKTDAALGLRRISVTVKPKGMTVQARQCYYPAS